MEKYAFFIAEATDSFRIFNVLATVKALFVSVGFGALLVTEEAIIKYE